MNFMERIKDTLNTSFNYSTTENGAPGYRTTGKQLLDLNFSVTSLRNADERKIKDRFARAFYEDPLLAVKWLFFASDVRGGLGERRLFRICYQYMAENHPEIVKVTMDLVPEYSRWDNLVGLLDTELASDAAAFIGRQLKEDLENRSDGKPVSLCAKWLPSVNASSEEQRRLARVLAGRLSLTEGKYRKILSELRGYLKIVESSMSGGKWSEIDYKMVPSRANLLYSRAFMRNDEARRQEYLESLKKGETTIHAGVLYPHDIVHRYLEEGGGWIQRNLLPVDDTLEELWKALPDYVEGAATTICVSDGSGSMLTTVGNTSVTCLDVANSLSIYFAERCKGPYFNKYITFSAHPQLVELGNGRTLRDKIEIARRYNEVANTDIEAVFDLILETAVSGHLRQEEMPSSVLILSDMEFDMAVSAAKTSERLFETLARRYETAGYRLPRLVFWNICSRTGTVPVIENKLGVALVSGFSPMTVKMVLSGQTDPYLCLLEQLEAPRYDTVEERMKGIV